MAQRKIAARVFRITWKLVIVLVVIGALAYYLRFRPIPVKTFAVKADTVRAEVMGTGTLDARTKITVSSKITGRIAALGADQNDPVSKDKLLATLDDSDLRQQVEMASATLEATKASLARAESEIIRAQAVLTKAKAPQAAPDEELVPILGDGRQRRLIVEAAVVRAVLEVVIGDLSARDDGDGVLELDRLGQRGDHPVAVEHRVLEIGQQRRV